MKRILLLAALGIVSCTAEPNPSATPSAVSVTFSLDAGTKALPDAINATLPPSLNLTIKNKATGSAFSTSTGQAVTLPVGDYSVTAHYAPKKSQLVVGNGVYLSRSPVIDVSQDVTIAAGRTEYALTGLFRSFVLAVDGEEAAGWTMQMNYNTAAVDFLTDGSTWWIFCTGDLSERFVTTSVVPKDTDGHRASTYNLTTSASYAAANGGKVVEPGRWYWLHPEAVQTEDAGMSLTFAEWTDGTWPS